MACLEKLVNMATLTFHSHVELLTEAVFNFPFVWIMSFSFHKSPPFPLVSS